MNPFGGESPENYEQKCLCVLVLDISSSMQGAAIESLNQGLVDFQYEVIKDYTAANRLEISIIIFGSEVWSIQPPALVNTFDMPRLTTRGTTKLVDAVRLAIGQVEDRKLWYKTTGQNYYRPMIILITDGEPDNDQDINGLAMEIYQGVQNKRFLFYAVGVQNYNHAKLAHICHPATPPMPLNKLQFSAFFKWLSNSIGAITKSKEGEKIEIPPVSGWTQMEL
ncbi:MAG: VWA domain-containing protein [Cytophagales bacterium]|nr:MAG: VWA domain-containing protein [Cytophagales bacterium]